MSYEVRGTLHNTREEALSALVGAYVYPDIAPDRDEALEALDTPGDTADELIADWGGDLGPGETPATAIEIADHIRGYRYAILKAVGCPLFQYREDSGHTEDLEATDLASAIDEARELLRDGDWPTGGKTTYVSAAVIDPYGGAHGVEVAIHPEEPECTESEHDWQSPHDLLGGLEENPGVWGKGGGVVVTEVCRHCGAYRITDTWDQSQGPEPVETIQYREADDASTAWVRANQAPSVLRSLIEDKGHDRVLSALRDFEDDPDAWIDEDDMDIKVEGEWLRGERFADLVDRLDDDLRWPY
ncbi:hypothetical protein [Thioalkalivibrio sp. ALE19]|uniref:hypothetical protein n=1 Tax=Thioalkalivibrio sp. ALE19 TaxID=1266909 RepID=UPI00040BEB8C|nr:hypothetical protein [Thioalkalivibrio sp. ALE19]